MPSAWDIQGGGDPGIIVTVLDSGVAYEDYGSYQRAPDLVGTNFLPGYDFVNSDSHPNDDEGHGTHVTGTIAQTTNNSLGVAGIAFDCSIMPVKVLGADGSGTYQQIADGVYYAVDSGAMVINCSLGGSSPSSTMYNAVRYAYDNDVVFVAATGNDNSIIGYPARYDECIAVGAVDINKVRAYYSNYGTGMELMAPGGDTSVDLNGDGYVDGVLQQTFSGGDPTNFAYWFWQGTSMATPHVTGLVALMLSRGVRGVESIRNTLHSTAEDLGTPGYDTVYGYGLIDAAAALSAVEHVVLEVDPSSLDFGEVGTGSSKTVTFRAYNSGGGTLSGTISDNRDWITVSSTSFEGNDNTISVTVETGALAESSSPYSGTVTLTSNGGTKTVDVSVTVIPTGAVAYPNPVSASDSTITFWGTSIPNAEIRIYTLTGELVRTLTEAHGDSNVSWDGRNDKGNLIARGVYYYTAKNFRGKFVVK
jgi:serine protease